MVCFNISRDPHHVLLKIERVTIVLREWFFSHSGHCTLWRFTFLSYKGLVWDTVIRSDWILLMSWPYFIMIFPLMDPWTHLVSFLMRIFSLKCCFTSWCLRIWVRSIKSVYLTQARAYLNVWAMNTPYDPALGMFPDKSGKFTILNGKSLRLSYNDVTSSWFTTSMLRSRCVWLGWGLGFGLGLG